MPEVAAPEPGQVTLGHIYQLVADEVIPRLGRVEEIVTNSGLNGHTPLLKAFLEQYAATYTRRQAWITVQQDITHRLRWLASPRRWLAAIFYAALGALGVQLVTGNFPFHF